MPRKTVTNWGNYPAVEANVTESSEISDIRSLVENANTLIARGNGRCYGDSSLGPNIFSTLKLNRILSFDTQTNTLECEAGVMLNEILEVFVPKGFFLPVTPGTKFITVGGAVAADVHGKNHHSEGSFSEHLLSFQLLTESGEIVSCSKDENAGLFWQTCGGMGLTGIILSARFKLKTIETSFIRQITHKAASLEKVMELFEKSANSTYSVAWIDCLARGKTLGRSMLMLGEHANYDELPIKLQKNALAAKSGNSLTIPFNFPTFSLNKASVKAFNFAYYYRQFAQNSENFVHYESFFYPLDGINNWNRIYGRKGFLQYQFVLPTHNSFDGLTKILKRIEQSGQGSFLAVLKLFGKPNPNAVMSFPIEGYTLALDFKVSPKVFRLLDELDEIVAEFSGRVYLAKDARMSAVFFHKTYSNIVTSDIFISSQSERLA
ncbi:MAG: FAD-binding oxidoreductase [Pyrinomonadaceae bacterium]